jgi:hypothetical protein
MGRTLGGLNFFDNFLTNTRRGTVWLGKKRTGQSFSSGQTILRGSKFKNRGRTVFLLPCPNRPHTHGRSPSPPSLHSRSRLLAAALLRTAVPMTRGVFTRQPPISATVSVSRHRYPGHTVTVVAHMAVPVSRAFTRTSHAFFFQRRASKLAKER